MIAHEKSKGLLGGKAGEAFIRELVSREGVSCTNSGKTRKVAKVLQMYEFPFSLPTEEVDIRGRPKASLRIVDMLFIVGLGGNAAFNDNVFTVGIEIKERFKDLNRDEKMQSYLSKTDYTFLAVPECMATEAINKVEAMDGMGVVIMPSGRIIKNASRHRVDSVMNKQVMLRALFSATADKQKTVVINSIGQFFPRIPPVEDSPKESSNNNN